MPVVLFIYTYYTLTTTMIEQHYTDNSCTEGTVGMYEYDLVTIPRQIRKLCIFDDCDGVEEQSHLLLFEGLQRLLTSLASHDDWHREVAGHFRALICSFPAVMKVVESTLHTYSYPFIHRTVSPCILPLIQISIHTYIHTTMKPYHEN